MIAWKLFCHDKNKPNYVKINQIMSKNKPNYGNYSIEQKNPPVLCWAAPHYDLKHWRKEN